MNRIFNTSGFQTELLKVPGSKPTYKYDFEITKETATGKSGFRYVDYYILHPNGHEEYYGSTKRPRRFKKYLAIGGPKDGQQLVHMEDNDYIFWQNSSSYPRKGIFVYKQLTD